MAPPFRADHVGSLLRPRAPLDVRLRGANQAELRAMGFRQATWGASTLLIWAVCVCIGRGHQDPTVPPELIAARLALGGDAALSYIVTLSLKGTRLRTAGRIAHEESVEYALALPDRFAEITRITSSLGPLGTATTFGRHGFNGNDLINDTRSDSPFPPPVSRARASSTPAERIAEIQRLVNLQKRHFARVTLPLFAASFPAFALSMTSRGRGSGPSGPADVLEATAADGFTWTLVFDAATHLLAGIEWRGQPIVVTAVTGVAAIAVGPAGQVGSMSQAGPPPILPPTPTNLPDVLWQMTVTDYRVKDGVNWPHRFITSFAGHKYEDLRLNTLKLNPKIDTGTFRTSK